MKTFNDLDNSKKKEIVLEARAWLNDHYSHVRRIVTMDTASIVPSIEDCLLGAGVWRPEHWAWFLDNMDNIGAVDAIK
jgi:hypothetical protein